MKSDYHQELMDKAYDQWHKNPHWSKKQFYLSLDPKSRAAVVFGNLNYQVENGGFYQWFDNSYGKESKEFLYFALDKMSKSLIEEESLAAKEMIELLNQVFEIQSDEKESNDFDEESYGNFEEMDNRFYQINNNWLIQVENWLKNESD